MAVATSRYATISKNINMTLSEFIIIPIIAYMLSFTVGYIMLSLFAFIRRSLW